MLSTDDQQATPLQQHDSDQQQIQDEVEDLGVKNNDQQQLEEQERQKADSEQVTNEVIAKLTRLEGGFQCLLDKVKQDIQAAKDVALFLKKRAVIEEEYGKQMIKLAQSVSETYEKNHQTKSSYGTIWTQFLKVHEKIGEQRVRFSSDIAEVSDDVQIMSKDIEKSRKQVKESGIRHERIRMEAEAALDKSKQRYDMFSEEWEKAIIAKNNSETADLDHSSKSGGLFKSNKTPMQLKRQVDESCAKANQAQSIYKNQLIATNAARQNYYQIKLPSDLFTLKSVDDECNAATRYQLARYSYLFEEALTKDGYALDNDDGTGLRSLTEKIDYDIDIVEVVKRMMVKATNNSSNRGHQQGSSNNNPRLINIEQEIPYKEYPMSATAMSILKPNPVFGIDLTQLMQRDGQEVPLVVQKCTEAVEQLGLKTVGIYRVSGTSTQIQRLKNAFDRDCKSVNLLSEENRADINNVTSLLKLWFRELPDPLFPQSSYQHFMNAARIENDRMRVLGLHTIINDLPDAHYATLKHIMCHLDRVQQNQEYNKMTIANLSTIFGLTLMGGDGGSNQSSISSHQENIRLADTQWHVKIVQTIIENYRLIFEPDEEDEGTA
ncbi:Rho GTPase activation protein [Mycotypha africana]|uniref:Rho GTPase activation protein n=1 Tax=Mycotypha africana TaxID=64632 RepID=UPI0023018343|nr:Rho GTPase activation protein [Mycotypha africana]KAI8981776.1 Rho GTPase activation protein [Mycotypha africana]